MRSWILGGCLATVAAGGVYFVATGGGSSTHCGPCVSCPAPEPTDSPDSPAVVEVVDVAAALAKPATPPERPFVSFDEPPLAKQFADRAKAPDVIQAAFTEPTGRIGRGRPDAARRRGRPDAASGRGSPPGQLPWAEAGPCGRGRPEPAARRPDAAGVAGEPVLTAALG